jgi:hypothetical protein
MPAYRNLMFITILCGLFSCNWRKQSYPKAVGLGLLSVNTQYSIPLYKNEFDKIPFDTLKFNTNKSGSISFVSNIKLKPYRMTAGDTDKEGENNVSQGLVRFPPELKFCVAEAGGSYFRVITNENTMEAYIIKKDVDGMYYTDTKLRDDDKYTPKWYVYETWERYLKRAEYISKENLIIYNAPDGKAIFENKNGAFLAFTVTEVKGEWIRIKVKDGQSADLTTTKNSEGWTQWRKGDKMLIDVIEQTYE